MYELQLIMCIYYIIISVFVSTYNQIEVIGNYLHLKFNSYSYLYKIISNFQSPDLFFFSCLHTFHSSLSSIIYHYSMILLMSQKIYNQIQVTMVITTKQSKYLLLIVVGHQKSCNINRLFNVLCSKIIIIYLECYLGCGKRFVIK